ncbi:MAG: nitrous oxide reductase accessory protein NosL, partial [Flavobacteriaceae bacterium]|nr:nitrous oxide reductase accessory protein NosL [Flavobacteriaceae bacterium]
MRKIFVLIALTICPILNNVWAQNNAKCSHCSMAVQDPLHKASAIDGEMKSLTFGSIECLVNYIKDKKGASFTSLKVSDYTTGNMIDAENASFLISKSIPSPMGANLSAFKTKSAAEAK